MTTDEKRELRRHLVELLTVNVSYFDSFERLSIAAEVLFQYIAEGKVGKEDEK